MYLHDRSDFNQLIEITANNQKIDDPSLVEKDYWIMHCLFCIKSLGYEFELKGGTSLSKGFGIIHRFSEDIDIKIDPEKSRVPFRVYYGKNHDRTSHRESRAKFFDWIAESLSDQVNGVESSFRDHDFDDPSGKFRNGGVKLVYKQSFPKPSGLKDGILLEIGFDQTIPNMPIDISSWVYDFAKSNSSVDFEDNRAKSILCYDPRYTFVEKLQTVVRKFRLFESKSEGHLPGNFLRHYYDIYHLLQQSEVEDFIGSEEYNTHKESRFKGDDTQVSNSGAFKVDKSTNWDLFLTEYENTKSLYYQGRPDLKTIMLTIQSYLDDL